MPEPFEFRWEPDTARYRDLATGRFVAQDTILDWCQQSIDASENVTDVQHTRYVGRRQNDHERINLRLVVRGEDAALFPHAVPLRL